MVRRFDGGVDLASCRRDGTANECPVDVASAAEQSARRSGGDVLCGSSIPETGAGEQSRCPAAGCVQIQVTGNNKEAIGSAGITHHLIELCDSKIVVAAALQVQVVR